MRIAKLLLSLILLFLGIFLTSMLYAFFETKEAFNLQVFLMILADSLLIAAISYFCIKRYVTKRKKFFMSLLFSYSLNILIFLIMGGLEALMWLPVMIMFAVPFCAPVIILSYFATLVFLDSLSV